MRKITLVTTRFQSPGNDGLNTFSCYISPFGFSLSDQPAHSGDFHNHLLKIILSNQSTFFLPLLTTKETKEKLASRHTPAPLESSPCEEEAHSGGCGHSVVEF